MSEEGRCVAPPARPSHEVSCFLAMADIVAGYPAFKAGLTTGRKGQILLLEPVQEMNGRSEMLPCARELVVRDLLAAAASAKPAQDVPCCVSVQDSPSLGRRVGGDEVLHVPFETDHLLVPPGQDSGGDEDAADVLDDLAFRELVEGRMGERPAAGAKIGQGGGDDALGESAHRGAGPLGVGQGVVKGLELRVDGTCVIGKEFVEPPLEGAARARSWRVQPFGLSADGTGAPELGVRRGAGAADGGVGGAGVNAAHSSADGAVALAPVTAAAAGQAGELRAVMAPDHVRKRWSEVVELPRFLKVFLKALRGLGAFGAIFRKRSLIDACPHMRWPRRAGGVGGEG